MSDCVTMRPNHSWGYVRRRHDGRLQYEHRWRYEQVHGPIPAGLTIDHLCQNKACVNPEHMEVVTGGENVRRSWRTNRRGWAERPGQSPCHRGHAPNWGSNGRRGLRCRTCHNERSRVARGVTSPR